MRKLAPRSTDATRADNLRRMESHAVTVALRELARHLTIAAGLCRAYRIGFGDGFEASGEGFNGEYASRLTAERFEKLAQNALVNREAMP